MSDAVILSKAGEPGSCGFDPVFGDRGQVAEQGYPGFALPAQGEPPAPLLAFIGRQLHIEPDSWPQYAKRPETRREHLAELQAWLNLTTFSAADH